MALQHNTEYVVNSYLWYLIEFVFDSHDCLGFRQSATNTSKIPFSNIQFSIFTHTHTTIFYKHSTLHILAKGFSLKQHVTPSFDRSYYATHAYKKTQ